MDVPANHIRSPDAANHVEVKRSLYGMYLCCPSHHYYNHPTSKVPLVGHSLSDSLHWHSSTLNLQCRWNLPLCLWFLVFYSFLGDAKNQPKPVPLPWNSSRSTLQTFGILCHASSLLPEVWVSSMTTTSKLEPIAERDETTETTDVWRGCRPGKRCGSFNKEV